MKKKNVIIYLLILLIQNSFVRNENLDSIENSKQVRKSGNAPQSLTLLMNFKNDGTTSFQIIQGSQIIYLDNGLCQYGQIFDPSTGRCRDIFCQEINHKFNGTTCIPDENKNLTNVHKRMSDIDLSLNLYISPKNHDQNRTYDKRLNKRMNETCTNNWENMFHDAFHGLLGIDYDRITKIRYNIQENNEHLTRRSIWVSDRNITSTGTLSNYTLEQILSNNHSAMLNLDFTITDRHEKSTDHITGLDVVTLLLIVSEQKLVLDLCQTYSIQALKISVISDKNKTQEEFCSDPDQMHPTTNGTLRQRSRSDGEMDFVVYVPELETTYEGGDFTYLFISKLTQSTPSTEDLKSELQSSSPPMKLVSVCNRQPRIMGRCPDSVVMRIAVCEIIQYKNFSIRLKRTGRLYTNREYRKDDLRPESYVVVCKHDSYNETIDSKLSFFEKAPGILTTIATFLSIIALAITLITFFLFSSLRNLPGWNTINLTIALIIAETLFLCQDLTIMTRSNVCLLFALGIHYFYLASFFWMNIMAYDLWKTFHKGFSLYLYDINERLPFYALYAWGMPGIIVLIGIILDVSDAEMKPCYGKYFRGCYDVCYRMNNDAPLQGCWIESATMRLILFGCPIAIILIINFVFYTLTVRNIRQGLKKIRGQVECKFQRKKQVRPGEHDVKIYMRMAVLTGFGWTIGFILFLLPDGKEGFNFYLVTIFKYLFILLNATPGLFIFVVYVCNRRVLKLYRRLIENLIYKYRENIFDWKNIIVYNIRNCLNRTKNQLEYFHQIDKHDIIPTDSSSLPSMLESIDLSHQRKFTFVLTEQVNQS